MTTPEPVPARRAPLAGLRVIELRTGTAGAFAGLILADLGAEVIKVDELAASQAATIAVDGRDCQRLAFDRNKRSLLLDVRSAVAQGLLHDVVRRADVLITQCPEVERLGLTPQTCPEIVHCAVGGNRHDDDLLTQALTGCMDLTGAPGDPPTRTGIPLAAVTAGLYGAIAALGGLQARRRAARGMTIEVDPYDTLIAFMNYVVTVYVNTGRTSSKVGAGHPTIYPYSAFRTRDSHIVVACFTQNFWRKFCHAIGQAELIEDVRFKSFSARLANKAELATLLEPIMLTHTTDAWEIIFTTGDVPVGPVYGLAEALAAPQTHARSMVAQADGLHTSYPTIHTAFNFAGAKPVAARAAPAPGDDSLAVLNEWLTAAASQLPAWVASGVVVQTPAVEPAP